MASTYTYCKFASLALEVFLQQKNADLVLVGKYDGLVGDYEDCKFVAKDGFVEGEYTIINQIEALTCRNCLKEILSVGFDTSRAFYLRAASC